MFILHVRKVSLIVLKISVFVLKFAMCLVLKSERIFLLCNLPDVQVFFTDFGDVRNVQSHN